MKTLISTVLALGLLTGTAQANVFDDLQRTAPKSIFDQLNETAPKTIWEQLNETAPRSRNIFRDLQRNAP